MLTNKFQSGQLIDRFKKNTLRIGFVAMLLFGFLNHQSIVEVSQNVRTIITPPNQSNLFWISSHDADEQYLISFGVYIADLFQSVTAANVENRFAKILALASSENYPTIQSQLKNRIKTVKRYDRNAYSFRYTKTSVNKKTQQIIILGALTRWTKTGKKREKQMQLKIGYVINHGTFAITNLDEEKLWQGKW